MPLSDRRARCLAAAGLLAAGLGCAHPGPALRREEAAARDGAGLAAAAEAFYAAASAEQLRAAVEAARRAGPETAVYHELAATLAWFEVDDAARFDHVSAALLDAGDDDPLLHFDLLRDIPFTADQRRRAVALAETLAATHPSAEVRSAAAYQLAWWCQDSDDRRCRDGAAARVDGVLPLAIIGGWDNDEGKGFDTAYPPEQEMRPAARYPGAVVEIGWRADPPRDFTGGLHLEATVKPATWAVAYAAATVDARGGDYELRLRTSDALEVFVNGQAILRARTIDSFGYDMFDALVLPIQLRPGRNRVLIKCANRARDNDWRLLARLTAPGGQPAPDVTPVPLAAPIPPETAPAAAPISSEASLVAARIQALPAGSMRRAYHQLEWTRRIGFRPLAVTGGEAFVDQHPRSAVGRAFLAGELWARNERDRTSDLVQELDRELGAAMPYFRLWRARFLTQERLTGEARRLLLQLRAEHPDRAGVRLALGEHFTAEGWTEDACAELEAAARLRPGNNVIPVELAACLEKLGAIERAKEWLRAALAVRPLHVETLRALFELAARQGDLSAQRRYAEAIGRAIPWDPLPYLLLGDARRRAGDAAGARAALLRARDLDPDGPAAYQALGTLAYQAGDRAAAIASWSAALARHPKDEALAHRLQFLAPTADEAWTADVPSGIDIDELVRKRHQVKALPGADVVVLLDHEVLRLAADGSTSGVITDVRQAANQAGRDHLLTRSAAELGVVRVLAAYAVDPDGKRVEAASIERGVARFRGLSVGSTVVFQYRFDQPPVGYLSRYLTRSNQFELPGLQMERSEWILWAPAGTPLHESRTDSVVREQSRVGEQLRVRWSVAGVAPVIAEPNVPPVWEITQHLLISTLPDWSTFLKWERALLQNAFRDSPELGAATDRLLAGAATAEEKLLRIHQFVMEEIRYQQHYENPIAGVKPHPAPLVLQRRYGDCKDKVVLFMTMARHAGLTSRFALVRTRGMGAVVQEVPMQQFNHAVVYVPQQAGLSAGRFFDPTADALELTAVPAEDAGTTALVFDPDGEAHEWRAIPFQPPAEESQRHDIRAEIAADGTTSGQLTVRFRGRAGSALRVLARNADRLNQAFRQIIGSSFESGAATSVDVVEARDLRQPATIKATFTASSLGRREGDELRVKIPGGVSPKTWFGLAQRRYPLLLGPPSELSWHNEIVLPPGGRLKRLPRTARIASPCLTLERRASLAGGTAIIDDSLVSTCEAVPVAEYAAHRKQADAMVRLLEEELVIDMSAPAPRPSVAGKRPLARRP
jgi:tetratricopeptide (TPR) repeat protein